MYWIICFFVSRNFISVLGLSFLVLEGGVSGWVGGRVYVFEL